MSRNKQLLSNSQVHQNIKIFGTYKRTQMQMLGLGLASHPGMDNDTIFSFKKNIIYYYRQVQLYFRLISI